MPKSGLKDTAYKYIYNAIMLYELKPGQMVVEQDLSSQLGISRTPVREALRQLEQEGLVRHIPSRGTFVEDLTVQDIEEIFQIRILLEVSALKNAIAEVTDEELDSLEKELLDLSEERIQEKKIKEDYFRSDRALHTMIMRYSRNSRMISFHRHIEAQMERLRRVSSLTPMRLSKSRQEHQSLISALRSRDLDRATDALLIHLNNVKESSLNVCRNIWLALQVSQ